MATSEPQWDSSTISDDTTSYTSSSDYSSTDSDIDSEESWRQKYKHLLISNDILQLQLHTKHLLTKHDRNNNELIELCINQIKDAIFDGASSKILDLIIENVKEHELKQIYGIIKNIKLNNDQEPKSDDNENHSLSPICKLPIECIVNICSHLSRRDIESVKITCYDIGVVCLQHMMRYSFGICNVNKFLIYPQNYPNIKSFDETLMNYNFYHPSTLLSELRQEWQQKYRIPQEFELLHSFRATKFSRNGIIIKNRKNTSFSISSASLRDLSKANRKYFLFDARHTVMITDNDSEPRILNKTDTKKINHSTDFMLVVQYFDIRKQSVYIIQTILLNREVKMKTILEYIEHKFIATTNAQQLWYKNLKEMQMKLSLQISLHPHIMGRKTYRYQHWEKLFASIRSKTKMVILALSNPNETPQDILEIKQQYEMKEEKFCMNLSTFKQKIQKSVTRKIKYLHNESILISYLKQKSSLQDANRFICTDGYEVEINKFSTYGSMRVQISKLFNNIIPPQNIQIYDERSKKLRVKLWEQRSFMDLQYNYNKSTYFNFVSNDVRNFLTTYYIKIFIPEKKHVIPDFDHHLKDNTNTLTIQYQDEFVVDHTFIEYVMNELSKPVYGDNFKHVLNLYNPTTDSDNDIMYAVHCDKDDKTYFLGDEFDGSDDLLMSDVPAPRMHLFMYKNPDTIHSNNVSKTISITVRFGKDINVDKKNIYTICDLKRLLKGIPIKMWIKPGEITADIVKENFSEYQLVEGAVTYRMITNDKKVELILVDVSIYKPVRDDVLILLLF